MAERHLRVMRGDDVLFETRIDDGDVVELIETANEALPDVAIDLEVRLLPDRGADESVIVPEPVQEEGLATTQGDPREPVG